jgi:hypothetical protein
MAEDARLIALRKKKGDESVENARQRQAAL